MASEEEACYAPLSSSSVGVEALFPAVEAEHAGGDGNPQLVRLRERLHGWLSPYEPVILWAQRLLVWERPLHSIFVAFTLNTLFWLVSSTSLRPVCLLCACLLCFVLLDHWKLKLPEVTVQLPEASMSDREGVARRPGLLSIAELSHHLAENYLTCSLYIQEVLQYKRLNQGQFCGLVCVRCLLLVVVGHYIPGIMISYIILLSVLVWPMVVYHELIQKMYTGVEPILMKLDYSMKGGAQHRKHDRKKAKKELEKGDESRAESESESESEEELSCFSPTVDVKTTALAMSITDSELSDEEVSILESGGFSVSRAATPQPIDVSEDLDRPCVTSEAEENFYQDLPEFPSVEQFSSLQGSRGKTADPRERGPLSPASSLIQHLATPLHFVNTHFNGQSQPEAQAAATGAGDGASAPSLSLEALSEEIVSTAISAVVQNTLTALLRSTEASEDPSITEFLPAEPTLSTEMALREEEEEEELGQRGPAEEEDFELLDQSELEQMDVELGLSPPGQGGAVDLTTPVPWPSQRSTEP